MPKRTKNTAPKLAVVLRRMRESASVTMRQAGGLVGISHVAISQFENGKLNLPAYRVEQLVQAYGFSKEEFQKILAKGPEVNLLDDCHAMVDRLDDVQLPAVHSILSLLFRTASRDDSMKPLK